MVVCKYYQQGNCRYGQYCQYEHINNFGIRRQSLAQVVAEDIHLAEKGGQWLLSCYAPLKGIPCLPGMEDLSPEEVRWEMYQAQKNRMIDQAKAQYQQLCQDMRTRWNALKNPSADMIIMLEKFENSVYTSMQNSGSTTSSSFTFATPQLGQPSSTSTPNLFSNQTFGGQGNPFGGTFTSTANASSVFTRQNSTAAFGGKPILGNSLFGNIPASNSIFGATKAATGFGGTQSSFGSAQTQSNSVFGGVPTQSAFGQAGSTSQSGNSIFGGAKTSTSSIFGATTISPNSGTVFGKSSSENISINPAFATKNPVAFGGGATFGGAPAFGSNTTSLFGGQAAFGNTVTGKNIFGNSNTSTAAFGSVVQSSNTFGTATLPNSTFIASTSAPTNTFGTATSVLSSTFGTVAPVTSNAFSTANSVANNAFGTAVSAQTSNLFTNAQTTQSALGFGTSSFDNPSFGAVTSSVSTPFVTSASQFGNTSLTTPPFSQSVFGTVTSTTLPFGTAPTTVTSSIVNAAPHSVINFGAPFFSTGATTSTTTNSNPFALATTKATSPFENVTQNEASEGFSPFGKSPFVSMLFKETIDDSVYSLEGQLTDDEKASYLADKFILGKIPLRPPTKDIR
ncbi:uncharacterized protein [Prorops nasuta]|uniref:uncharacterized protein isoform X2 n=1 Tax=Prorops nasuta TaxID=863751 RepID=UPI0034CD9A58